VGLAAKGAQLCPRCIRAFGFGPDVALKFKHLIAANDHGIRVTVGQFAGLHLGQGISLIAWLCPFGLQGGADGLFIDAGRNCFDRDARLSEKIAADG
jgi:hypothetical protein